MTIFRPCIGCTIRNNCAIKRAVISSLKGVPISAAVIRCDWPYVHDFPPGTRVNTRVFDERDRDYEGSSSASDASATVIKKSTSKRGRLLLHLDEPALKIGGNEDIKEDFLRYSTAYPKDLTKLDEPLRVLCLNCGVPMADGETCNNKECWGDRE